MRAAICTSFEATLCAGLLQVAAAITGIIQKAKKGSSKQDLKVRRIASRRGTRACPPLVPSCRAALLSSLHSCRILVGVTHNTCRVWALAAAPARC